MVLQVRLADYTYTVLNNIMHCLEQKVGISAEISNKQLIFQPKLRIICLET